MRDTSLGITRRSSRVPFLRVTVTAGDKFGDTFELTLGEHAVGTSRQASVQLNDEGIERRHALLHVAAGHARLEPLPTKVGTWCNGERLSGPLDLSSGDELEIGACKLEVELLDPPADAPPTSRSGRRRRAEGLAQSEDSDESGAVPKRRVTSSSVRGRGGEQRAAAVPRSERPSFGSDQTAVYLANFFRTRPNMKFDFALLEKARTHGYYTGDGRDERTLEIGFEPLHVLIVEPAFAQLGGGFPPTDHKGNFREPGPPPPPESQEKGFTVGPLYNKNGVYYRWVAWRDAPYEPGPPLFSIAPG